MLRPWAQKIDHAIENNTAIWHRIWRCSESLGTYYATQILSAIGNADLLDDTLDSHFVCDIEFARRAMRENDDSIKLKELIFTEDKPRQISLEFNNPENASQFLVLAKSQSEFFVCNQAKKIEGAENDAKVNVEFKKQSAQDAECFFKLLKKFGEPCSDRMMKAILGIVMEFPRSEVDKLYAEMSKQNLDHLESKNENNQVDVGKFQQAKNLSSLSMPENALGGQSSRLSIEVTAQEALEKTKESALSSDKGVDSISKPSSANATKQANPHAIFASTVPKTKDVKKSKILNQCSIM